MDNNFKSLFHLDKNSPVPMYFQIKQAIIKAIKNGLYQTGDQLPTELEFCQELGISRPTIRQAFQELINEGYITRMKAKGTFVSKPKVDGFFFKKLTSYNDEMKQLGLTPKTNLLLQEVEEADEVVARHLKINEKDRVLHLARLRYADDEPMVYVHTYVPCDKFKGIENENFNKQETSLYELMKKKYNMPIAYLDRTIEAINATNELSSLLQINENAAVYTITTVSCNQKDEPIEYSIAKYRGDRNKFTIRLVQQ